MWHSAVMEPSRLLVAADTSNTSLLDLALKAGDDVNQKHPYDSKSGFNRGATPIMYATRSGHADIVRRLLNYGADLSAVDAEDWNAFHYAAFNGHADIIRSLLDHLGTELAAPLLEASTAFEQATPLNFARHRCFVAASAALGDHSVTPLDPELSLTRRRAALKKLKPPKTSLFFRYQIAPGDWDGLRAWLTRDTVVDGPWTAPAVDMITSAQCALLIYGTVKARGAAIPALVNAGRRVLRRSSVSAVQHILVTSSV